MHEPAFWYRPSSWISRLLMPLSALYGAVTARRLQREGFDAGAVAALRQSRSVIGSLADRIRVPEQFVVAVENALGHHLQLVLTEQPESAQEILADLNANKAGRASVAALAIQQQADDKQLAFSGDLAPGVEARNSAAQVRRSIELQYAAAGEEGAAGGAPCGGVALDHLRSSNDGGVVFAVVLGAIGGLLPARMAAKKEILTALREV